MVHSQGTFSAVSALSDVSLRLRFETAETIKTTETTEIVEMTEMLLRGFGCGVGWDCQDGLG